MVPSLFWYGSRTRKAVKKTCRWHVFRPWESPPISQTHPLGMWMGYGFILTDFSVIWVPSFLGMDGRTRKAVGAHLKIQMHPVRIWMGLILAPHRLSCTNIKIYIKPLLQMHFLPKYGIVPTGDRYVLYDE